MSSKRLVHKTCPECGKAFSVVYRERDQVTCSHKCGTARSRWRTMDRFWKYVERRVEDECWIWNGPRVPSGYGRIRWNGRDSYAHRCSYELHKGPVPPGMHVCHTCDNPPCVNPKHLFHGTRQDNMQDSVRKGRMRNQKKTHCYKGHPFTPDNTYCKPSQPTYRRCRICRAANYKRAQLTLPHSRRPPTDSPRNRLTV